jgi:hypothetical protein
VVEEGTRAVSWEIATFWVAGIAVFAAVVTVFYGEIQRRAQSRQRKSDEEQLRLAREQATLRPDLEVFFYTVAFHKLPPDTLVPHEQASVACNITNNGKAAAHGVHCIYQLEEPLGAHDPMMGEDHDFQANYIGPKQTFRHHVRVSVHDYGWTKARYVCICDEVGESEGVVEFEVRKSNRR